MSFIEKELKERIQIYKNIKEKNPNKIPVILQRLKGSKLNNLINSKYVVPLNVKLSFFLKNIKDQLKLEKDESIVLYSINNQLLSNDLTVYYLNQNFESKDGFVYIFYSELSSFGNNYNK